MSNGLSISINSLTLIGTVPDGAAPTPPCCGAQIYPMSDSESTPSDYLDTSVKPYEIQGTCNSTLVFSVTYDREIADPFHSTDIFINGSPIGLSTGGSVSFVVSPGDLLFFLAIMGVSGIGPGTFTFRVINQTCGEVTPSVIFVATLGA